MVSSNFAFAQPQSRKMKNAVGRIERGIQYVSLEDIATNVEDANARVLQGVLQVLRAPADKIVVDHELFDVLAKQAIGGMRAN